MAFDFDYIVVGSGFGGSVAALRLTEKGYSVAVLEAGRRFGPGDFARTNWNLRRWLWAPALGCYGIQRLTLLDDVLILSGAGVGGGSLVYANTLLVPPRPFFEDPQWKELDEDWQKTLEPFFATAKRMLGVARNPRLGRADEALYDYARQLGREQHFQATEVGVFFGEPGVEVPDPYFGGEGPARRGCDQQGHCIVGCRNGGKNSLDRNYLYLAEKKGCRLFPDSTVVDIVPLDGGGYRVVSRRTSGLFVHPRRARTARSVVLAAGTLGTNELLLGARARGRLPRLSPRLGRLVRTNSEVLNGVVARGDDHDYSKGIAITSSLFVDEVTHVEPVRYPAGSDVMALLATLMVDGGGRLPRWLRWIGTALRHPRRFLRTLWPFGWARRAVICLVMQTLDNHIELQLRRRWWWPFRRRLTSTASGGRAPTYIPQGNEAARALALRLDGEPR
ncbi:MAG: GMC family oxidoreductase, partial [Deltaproteobacteria bacterium]|nr:GMC family oxidoreductase [Deltaproteobacteria bacterium]